jgi:hypothetical protein
MAWTYHPDHAGIGAYLKTDVELRQELHNPDTAARAYLMAAIPVIEKG